LGTELAGVGQLVQPLRFAPPWIARYELPVKLKDRFPNRGDKAEIAAVFTSAAVDGRLVASQFGER